ncbi:MAG: acyl-CoA dehydrogenase family protein [Bacteroidetes bacterium]|nr:acyl-CoA dehydrogenase family protein [Bacteroidota bacterium]
MSEVLEDVKTHLKGGEFLVKESSHQDIFIKEELDEEQGMIYDMVQDFLKAEVLPVYGRLEKQEEGLTPALLEKAGELGLLGMAIPEEYGGFGKDFNTNSVVLDAMSLGKTFSLSWGAHIGIGTMPILYFGNEEQKQKYLPKLASGELKASYCLTEPGSGSDALAAKTRADLSEDGKHYILNGQKMWITNAGFADVFIVFAKVDGDKFTGFIVEKGYEGLSLGAEEDKMGIKASSTRQVFLENVKVPVENLLGEIGKGHLIAFNILNIGRYKLGLGVIASSRLSSTNAVKYANERHQFKKPISSFGAIQYKLAEQAIRIYAGESAVYRVSDMIDKKEKELISKGKQFQEAILGAADEYAIECAILKFYCSEVLDYVVDETVQVYGGMGYSEEAPAASAYRDARINRIFEGTNEINRMLTIDMLMKRAMNGSIDIMGAGMAVQKELMGIPEFGDSDSDMFSEEIKAVKNAKKAVLVAIGGAAQKLMGKLKYEQEIMMNGADMIAEAFVMESVLLRTQKLVAVKGEEAAAVYVDMMKAYFSDAAERLYVHGKHAVQSFAEGDEARIMLMGIKRFTKYPMTNTKQLRRNVAAKLIEANEYCF